MTDKSSRNMSEKTEKYENGPLYEDEFKVYEDSDDEFEFRAYRNKCKENGSMSSKEAKKSIDAQGAREASHILRLEREAAIQTQREADEAYILQMVIERGVTERQARHALRQEREAARQAQRDAEEAYYEQMMFEETVDEYFYYCQTTLNGLDLEGEDVSELDSDQFYEIYSVDEKFDVYVDFCRNNPGVSSMMIFD